jgi:hypothetical protein
MALFDGLRGGHKSRLWMGVVAKKHAGRLTTTTYIAQADICVGSSAGYSACGIGLGTVNEAHMSVNGSRNPLVATLSDNN